MAGQVPQAAPAAGNFLEYHQRVPYRSHDGQLKRPCITAELWQPE